MSATPEVKQRYEERRSGVRDQMLKLQRDHRAAHHALDALGAPVVVDDKPLTLAQRIKALRPERLR